MLEVLKRSSITGDQLTEISDLQNNEKRVTFKPGNRQLNGRFSEQVHSLLVPEKYCRTQTYAF